LEASADKVKSREDTKEVRNYTLALEHGLKRLPELPLSKRLIREIHSVLLHDVSPERGARIKPGQFKTDQNWIGARLIQNARYVPPPPAESLEALDALEKYIHGSDKIPLLVKIAMIHCQFEAMLFDIPAITIPHAMTELKITYNSAKNNIQRLIDLEIIQPRALASPSRPQWFFADEIMRIVDIA
jgi:hypothetical protein